MRLGVTWQISVNKDVNSQKYRFQDFNLSGDGFKNRGLGGRTDLKGL